MGVTGPQRLALRMIGTFPGVSLSELADLLHIDRGTLTGVLERLVSKRLVARRLDPSDARRSRLTLTPRGLRLNAATAGTIEATVQRALRAVSAAKLAAASDVLEALANQLIEPSRPSTGKPGAKAPVERRISAARPRRGSIKTTRSR
jgi:MarR family transcriptional regulator, organic hydroperoxide resistance regulator